jgi:5-methyltetrahydrofolate--homocysteine methyltransferase
MNEMIEKIYLSILKGNKCETETGVMSALEAKLSAEMILYEAMIPAMDEVGRLYEKGEFFVPEMLVAAQAMRSGLGVVKPYLSEKGIKPLGTVAIGTVKGDLHDIGKNLVGMMLEGAGFRLIDLGVDTGPEKYIKAIESGAQIIGLSALLTTTMPQMEIIIDQISKVNLRNRVRIMVGGAPVTKAFAVQIGADGFASNASEAVTLARELIRSIKNE